MILSKQSPNSKFVLLTDLRKQIFNFQSSNRDLAYLAAFSLTNYATLHN